MKRVKIFLAMLLLGALVLTLTACGNPVAGRWRFAGGTAMGQILGGTFSMDFGGGLPLYLELEKDAFQLRLEYGAVSLEYEGTMQVEGKNITLLRDGEVFIEGTWQLQNDRLTITTDNGEILFDKIK